MGNGEWVGGEWVMLSEDELVEDGRPSLLAVQEKSGLQRYWEQLQSKAGAETEKASSSSSEEGQ